MESPSSKPKVLVVEDDPEMRGLIQRYLGENGFAVRTAGDGRAMDAALGKERVDIILLDLGLPHEDGLSICRRLRFMKVNTPIIMVTAKGDPIDRILGLEMGADMYMPKPFNPRELLASIQAMLRRTEMLNIRDDEQIAFGEFLLDLGRMQLTRDGAAVAISSREFAVLKALAQNAGRPVTRAKLIDLSMGRDAEVTDRSIDVSVTRLRKVLNDDPQDPRHVRTVWGVGYMLVL